MAERHLVCRLGVIVLVIVLLPGAMRSTALAQSPDDLYQTGPDPIAPELPTGNVGPGLGIEEQAASGKEDKEKDKKDDLDMLDMDLEQLSQVAVNPVSGTMGMEVSTVNRTESTVARSPAAVYVITNEMIRRSGARNLPEVLRLAPGVQVAQITKTIWAITIRGFNGVFSNKLLVQIDGRAVYMPSFGGVSWDQNYVLLEDVERIEVIRGPGAAVWGANAVNGVINIVTKSSADTKGLYAYSGGGSEHRSFNALRVGGQKGDLHWRMYGMQTDDGPGYFDNQGVPGLPTHAWDAFQFGQGGFRMDWTPNRYDTLTFQGDFLSERETYEQFALPDYLGEPEAVQSTNFLGRWSRKLSDETDWMVQMYYDGFKRNATGVAPRVIVLDTFDLDTQYHTAIGERHDVVCGFGFRNYDSTIDPQGGSVSFNPTRTSLHIISYFVQDTVELRPDRTFLTAGVKFVHNNFTGFEYQPSVRLLITPNEQTSLWGAVSRAVRLPSISERNIDIFGGFIEGNRDVRSEDVLAYELGIRRQATERFYWDLAVFYNRYDKLIGIYPIAPPPSIASNIGYGSTYGYELVATYEVTPDWRLRGAYSFLVEDIDYGTDGAAFLAPIGYNPRNQCFVHSSWDLTESIYFDMILRYVDRLPVGVPHYLNMDVRLAWEPMENFEVALVGQNLLDNHHWEFLDINGSTEVQSGVYGMLTWRR